MRLAASFIVVFSIGCLAACGESESSEASGTSTSTDTTGDATTTTTSESSSSDADSSTGGIPDACPDVALETGIVGRTDRRTCDILATCVMPESGVALAVYATNPQVGGSDTEPGMLDAAAVSLGDLNTGVGGRFEFLLPSGTYHICASAGAGMVFCSGEIVLSEDDPVIFAVYETGLGSSWNTISCGL
jgi:hypothetical protein